MRAFEAIQQFFDVAAEHLEIDERLREALQDAIRRVKVRPDEDLNELGSASTQGGGKVLGPQKPTE